MQNAGTTGSYTSISDHYAVLIQSICDISESYHYLGKLGDALNILKIGEQLARSNEVRQRDQTKLLLQYSKILINNYFITNQDYDLTLSTALQAKQVTEDVHDEQGTADALDLIGQAYYHKLLVILPVFLPIRKIQNKVSSLLSNHLLCEKILASKEPCQLLTFWLVFCTMHKMTWLMRFYIITKPLSSLKRWS